MEINNAYNKNRITQQKNMKKVSIVIINWNGLKYLKQTIPIVQDLIYENKEIVLIDNGSNDGSLEYIRQFPDIKIVAFAKNVGTSKGRNAAIQASTGDYILMLDNDIVVQDDNILTKLIDYHNKVENPGFINVLMINKEQIELGKTRQYGTYYKWYGIERNKLVDLKDILAYKEIIKTVACFSGNMFVSRKVWDDLGGFDESQLFNIDDDDISTRATVYGYNNYIYNDTYFIHIGEERRFDKKHYAWGFRMYYSGKARPIIKNFQGWTATWMWFFFSCATVAMAFKHAIFRLYPPMIWSLIYSKYFFLKNLPSTFRERKKIQKKRKRKDSEFLYWKVPNYAEASKNKS